MTAATLNKRFLSLAALGLSSLSAYYLLKDRNLSLLHAQSNSGLKYSDFPPSRSVNGSNHSPLKITLFQYHTCPFCCKVRAYLNYYGYNYDIVEVNSVWRSQLKWSDYKKVPVLVAKDANDETVQINDSSVIVSALQTLLLDSSESITRVGDYYPQISFKNEKGKTVTEFENKYFVMLKDSVKDGQTADERKNERYWRSWVDSHFVHVLSPNIYRTPQEAVQSFRWFDKAGEWEKHFSSFERTTIVYLGAAVMFILGKVLKSKYGLDDDVRRSFYQSCNDWLSEVGPKKFAGGDSPNLADLAVYGVLSSIEGCNAFADLRTHTRIGAWYDRVADQVNRHAGAEKLSSVKRR